MANFCTKCGTPSSGAAFCAKCGANLGGQPVPPPVQAAAAPAPAPAPVATYTPAPPAPHKGMSTLAKVAIAFFVVVVLVGAAGVVGAIYVAHRVKQKVNEVTGGMLSDTHSHSSSTSANSSPAFGDVCRFLSKDEVSRALNVTVVGTKSEGDSCSYLVHGNTADLTAKHIAAIGGGKGADAQQQNMIQNFAGTIFKSQTTEGHEPTSDANGNAPVLVVGLAENGVEQMRLERGVIGRFPGSEQLPGIGDEAFVAGDIMITARKGNRLLRLMYSTCPCTTKEVSPLARKVATEM
ncbi:hypothetical protein Acid345_1113 [Candidatus Koribacter versatilis Ellin345]|uniref:Zinc-ribbon domain-containing protein n=1 Tax=Koribacter versatilis (strain Ellin345) TaxID=204669 RepID=Q1ISN4_KORVE|nr:zinc ribbon domain-containing protein [Candidatus Koribacter versatilis]ABF40116.1 hypothetical protein Acid345_1113 [Candidatus Koribacter versatilis Ellin345]